MASLAPRDEAIVPENGGKPNGSDGTTAPRPAEGGIVVKDDDEPMETSDSTDEAGASAPGRQPDASQSDAEGGNAAAGASRDISDELRPEDAIDAGTRPEGGEDGEAPMDIQKDDEAPDEEAMLDDMVSSQEGKRVKVYELRESSWFDRGTGYCKGVYDEQQELAFLIVEKEETEKGTNGEAEAPGGFLREELLLSSRVEKEDVYGRQQDTLIVWTEPSTGLDIALSFQDAEGCEDIWQFICEVQRHLNCQPLEEPAPGPSSSSPLTASPMLGSAFAALSGQDSKTTWQTPTLANIKEQEMLLRMQIKSPQGRERAVEHILTEDYIRALIQVFEQAEDLESLSDLHSLCALMQTIILFNDNGVLEYILQDDVFMGVLGMLEYDPDYPSLKAQFRQIFQEVAHFRSVIDIKDWSIRQKIHQTYRLQYLKEVVLARLLDDPTFGILNSFIFYNQVDIITHIQGDASILNELFGRFSGVDIKANGSPKTEADRLERDQRLLGSVLFLHQLMLIGKSLQQNARVGLYRMLLDKGLLIVCEWALPRSEANIVHASAEMLTLMVDHDPHLVRVHVLKEEEAKRETVVTQIIRMMCGSQEGMKNMGLLSQLGDILRTLLDPGTEEPARMMLAFRKTSDSVDNFLGYVYDSCANQLYKPLLDLPDIERDMDPPFKITREQSMLLQILVEMLSYGIANHGNRASYFILSHPISKKVVGLLYIRDKPLRHAALRYVRACLRVQNHFIHRHFTKNDLLKPVMTILQGESQRDNMLSSACMDVLDLIRKENMKGVINYLFEQYRPTLTALGKRPYFKNLIHSIELRWEQINEPPPPPRSNTWTGDEEEKAPEAVKRELEASEDKYFNDTSDDEDDGPGRSAAAAAASTSQPPQSAAKRRRRQLKASQAWGAASSSSAAVGDKESPATSGPSGSSGAGSLGLDYDDNSDSDSSSAGAQSPRVAPVSAVAADPDPTSDDLLETMQDVEAGLGDVAMKVRAKRQREEEEEEEGFGSLLAKPSSAASGAGRKSPSPSASTAPSPSPSSLSPSTSATASIASNTTTTTTTTTPKRVIPEKREGTPLKEVGKKIKLNFGFGLGKRLGGGGSEPSDQQKDKDKADE